MKTLHDYESWGRLNFNNRTPELLETFAGTEIVRWHGKIEGQLVGLLDDAEKGRNYPYADKLREFIKIWRANEITGSINRETLETLKAASDVLSVDNWNLGSYFRSLATQLKVLVASEEQLPRDVDMNQNDPTAGGGGGRGAPPMSPSFGPGQEGPEGAEGGAGGAGGGGGGAPGLGGAPEAPGGAGMPDEMPPEPGAELGAAGEGEEGGPMGPTGGPEPETPEEELERM